MRNFRVEPFFFRINEFGGLGYFKGGIYLFVGRVGFSPLQIIADRAFKKDGALRNDAEYVREFAARVVFDVVAEHVYGAFRCVVKSRYQTYKRTFAASGTAENAERFALFESEICVRDRGGSTASVSEIYVL